MSRAARPERPAYQAAIEVVWTNLPQAAVSGRRSANVAFISHSRHSCGRDHAWLVGNTRQHIVAFAEV